MSVVEPQPAVPATRTGAFARVRARYLPLWAIVGVAAVLVLDELLRMADIALPAELVAIGQYAGMIAWLLFVARRHHIDLGRPFSWPRIGVLWFVVAGILVVAMLFSLATTQLTSLLLPWLTEAADLGEIGQGNVVLALLAIVVLPGLVEESVFRFALVERWSVKWNVWVAVVVSAIAFGILHGDPLGATAFGIVTALLYLRTGSLWPGILLHATNNLLALLALRLFADQPEVTPSTEETLVSVVLLLALSVPFLVWFFISWWPRRGPAGVPPATPYQRHELAGGLPDRRYPEAGWSAAPGRSFDLVVTSTQVQLCPLGQPEPIAVLPLDRIRAVYPTPVPGGQAVVLVLHDGSWTSVQVAAGHPDVARELTAVLIERAGQAAWRVRADQHG